MASRYRAFGHPDGPSPQPLYRLEGRDLIRCLGHDGADRQRVEFQLRGDQLYRTGAHPDGLGLMPD